MTAPEELAPPRRWPWFVGSFLAGLAIGAILGAAGYLALLMLNRPE